jgi:hypothetical protein
MAVQFDITTPHLPCSRPFRVPAQSQISNFNDFPTWMLRIFVAHLSGSSKDVAGTLCMVQALTC